MSINTVEKIDNRVKVRHVLVSVSDKKGLKKFVLGLLAINPLVKIYSTGGTYDRILEFLGDRANGCLIKVSDYTGQPEMQGGLVKTLDFRIYLGILAETYNDAHQADLIRTEAVPIDMVVVNLYPFSATIAVNGVTVEQARGNIDIGGPCMIRASAKNFLRVVPVVDPDDYDLILSEMRKRKNAGMTTLKLRHSLAQKAFWHTADYDRTVATFLGSKDFSEMKGCYKMQ